MAMNKVTDKFLGVTENNEIVLVNVGIDNANTEEKTGRFSVSFVKIKPEDVNTRFSNHDAIEEYYEGLCDNNFYDDYKHFINLLREYDCSIADLPKLLTESDVDNEYSPIIDNSCYPDIRDIGGKEIVFESLSGGQCDTRDQLMLCFDEQLTDEVFELWDKYHLKEITGKDFDAALFIIDKLDKQDVDEEIDKFVLSIIDEI